MGASGGFLGICPQSTAYNIGPREAGCQGEVGFEIWTPNNWPAFAREDRCEVYLFLIIYHHQHEVLSELKSLLDSMSSLPKPAMAVQVLLKLTTGSR